MRGKAFSILLPLFCLKIGYKFSSTRDNSRLFLTSPAIAPEESASKAYSISFPPYILFTFPQFPTLGNLKPLSFVLSFLYKFIVLCVKMLYKWSSKPLFWITFHWSFSHEVSAACIKKFVCFSLIKLSFVTRGHPN